MSNINKTIFTFMKRYSSKVKVIIGSIMLLFMLCMVTFLLREKSIVLSKFYSYADSAILKFRNLVFVEVSVKHSEIVTEITAKNSKGRSPASFDNKDFSSCAIRGIVINKHNVPITDANIKIFDSNRTVLETMTDDSGRFSLSVTRKRGLKIRAFGDRYYAFEEKVPRCDSDLIIILFDASFLEGKIVDYSTNKPLSGAKIISFWDSQGAEKSFFEYMPNKMHSKYVQRKYFKVKNYNISSADSKGRYRIKIPSLLTNSIAIKHNRYPKFLFRNKPLPPGETITNNILLTSSDDCKISLTTPKKKLLNETVNIQVNFYSFLRELELFKTSSYVDLNDFWLSFKARSSNGKLSLAGCDDDAIGNLVYRVTWGNFSSNLFSIREITHKKSALKKVVKLRRSLALWGKVVDSKGKPVENVQIHLAGLDTPSHNQTFVTTTRKSGKYFFKQLVPGKYVLRIKDIHYSKLTREISINHDTQENLSIPLRECFPMYGIVTDKANKPVNAAVVQVLSDEGYTEAETRTDEKGKFQLPRVPSDFGFLVIHATSFKPIKFNAEELKLNPKMKKTGRSIAQENTPSFFFKVDFQLEKQ